MCVCGCLCENAMVCVRATLAPSQINRMRLKFYTNSFRSVRFALLCFICRAISTFSLFVFHFFFFSFLVLSCVVFGFFMGAWRQLNELLFIVLEHVCEKFAFVA